MVGPWDGLEVTGFVDGFLVSVAIMGPALGLVVGPDTVGLEVGLIVGLAEGLAEGKLELGP